MGELGIREWDGAVFGNSGDIDLTLTTVDLKVCAHASVLTEYMYIHYI